MHPFDTIAAAIGTPEPVEEPEEEQTLLDKPVSEAERQVLEALYAIAGDQRTTAELIHEAVAHGWAKFDICMYHVEGYLVRLERRGLVRSLRRRQRLWKITKRGMILACQISHAL